jgi:S-adenosylmethionine:tRNA ribosyltransferase-isomerase
LQYHARVQRHDFAYDLPPDLIAQTPLAERSASRLLVLDDESGAVRDGDREDVEGPGDTGSSGYRASRTSPLGKPLGKSLRESPGQSLGKSPNDTTMRAHDRTMRVHDRTMRDFPSLLRPGDLLVFNDTKVVAARLVGTKSSGGRVEIFLERVVAADAAIVQLRASKPIREGLEVTTAGGVVRVLGREDDLWRVSFPGPALEFFEQWGDVPLPPYIHRQADANDRERYQSIFARERGAVAAPTASLHFDLQLVREIEARGVRRAFVTLHVGAGTFQPVRVDDLESHVMHAERVSVSAATCTAIEETRASGGRVIAIGTTVVRALESAALVGGAGEPKLRGVGKPKTSGVAESKLRETGWSGETCLFIRPGFNFQVTDALLTNFHLPESTLLMLVCAFAGKDDVLAAYAHAVRARYRFFSYGDAMFLTRARTGG